MKNRKRGFTLIELLVVVLIIGILAAVALPQYQVAVAKARFVQMQIWGNAIWEAEQIYYLENGNWTEDFNELILDLGGEIVSKNEIFFGEYFCALNGEVQVICGDRNSQKRNGVPTYFHGFRGGRVCRAYSAFEGKVCRSLGGISIIQNCSEEETNYCQYRLP